MLFLLKRFLKFFLILAFITSVCFGQSQPYLSAPVNGSTWEMTTPNLYWWYVPSPYSAGPYNYNVQLSTSPTDFTGSSLLVNAVVTGYGAAYYSVNSSVGLNPGITYYWRVGINGIYSSVWSFSPYGTGSVTTYTITAAADTHGAISPSGSVTVTRGSNQSFTIVPNSGYSISGVLVDGISVGALSSYTFNNVTASHSISASFAYIPVYDTTYVSILGSDSDGDGSWAKPYRRIQRGLDKAIPGNFVYVFDGVYLEDVVITKPITILGETGPTTRSFIVRANNITIKNFNLNLSSPGPGIQKIGLESYNHLDRLTLENVNAYNNAEMGLLLENIDTVDVKNCKFYGNDMGGIAIFNCNHLSFTNIELNDNLRGFAAYHSNSISIDQLNSEDNGKAYPDFHPDKNGMTFTLCNDITMNSVTSINNQEQGIKFEDCSQINMNGVSAIRNRTDGIAFIESDQINYTTGTVSKNGVTIDDNGIEIIACDKINFNTIAANENFNTGILFDLFYKGVYKWDPSVAIPNPLPRVFLGQTTDVTFTDVSACSNGMDGLYGLHLSYTTLNNPNFTGNSAAGIRLDAAHNIFVAGGTFDSNNIGIVLSPTVNIHPVAPKLSTDEITNFSLTEKGSISNNASYGILINPAAATKVTEPLFYGDFMLQNNGIAGLKINGKVTDPIFSGLYFRSNTSTGVEITDISGTDNVSGVKIKDSFFDGYGITFGRFAIVLTNGGLISRANVDAANNVFVGAGGSAAVENCIWHKNDDWVLGSVTFTGWTNGQPSIKIGSASAYTTSLVTIPVKLDIRATPLSFTQLLGKITFDEHKIRYKYTTYGTGTIIHDAGWGILFDHSSTDELRFISFGFIPINSSGVLFNVTFEVADINDGTAAVQGIASDWTINGGAAPFVVINGTVTYTSSTSTSLVKGDPTLDFSVDNWDYIAVLNHVNGIPLTGQRFLNADVNKDNRVDELDAADIISFINNGVWPGTASASAGELSFAASSTDQEGIIRFPITIYNSSNVRSLQVELKYDDSKIDFRNYVQLMRGDKYYLEVKNIDKGTTRLLFTSADKSSGTLVPAELFFNLKTAGSTAGLISSSYSINGSASKTGPTYGGTTVGIETEEQIPSDFIVEQNYPNPFNPSTIIRYSLPKSAPITIRVYDILGSLVNTLVNTEMPAGNHQVAWNGDNSSGARVTSGTYFYQVISGSNIITRKMMLIK